jgi:D-glycero-alpha-D-manno-heptose-7-phosphate kinase
LSNTHITLNAIGKLTMIITQTPLRISLAGGGTDFPQYYERRGGAVLSTAIDKYVFVVLKERFDNKIYINYSKKEIADSVDEIQHDLVREAMRMTGVEMGVEITTLADIPSEGTGLGSSSSITVGLLNALYAYKGEQVTAERLAREACRIEIEILGSPIGIQDQYIAAYGGLRVFNFRKNHKVKVEPLNINGPEKMEISSKLLLFFTDITRRSNTILSGQKANIQDRLGELDKIKRYVGLIRKAVCNRDFDKIGYFLHQGWMEKKKLSDNITNQMIDELYERALNAGALGGKISGAGGGGFLLVYCPLKHQDRLRDELGDLRELHFRLEPQGSKVIFNIRRELLK